MRDTFIEIWESVRRNKLRTFLTGFAVAWGIFILIVLLGAGNGLMNAFLRNSDNIVTNSMMAGGGWTSKPYDGLKQGRRIKLNEKDVAVTEGRTFSDVIDDVSPSISMSVEGVAYGEKHLSGQLYGIQSGYGNINKVKILHGRFINEKDVREERKVLVVSSDDAAHFLGQGVPTESLVGGRLKVSGMSFLVVGIFKGDGSMYGSRFYVPFTTLKTIYGIEDINRIEFTFHGLDDEAANAAFEKRYRAAINGRHRAAPDDEGALWIWNRMTQNLQMQKGTGILNIALWIIGLFTLLSGIVGVSNIMLITVKERTHEFGIRKAIGASPRSIMKLIISESVAITAFFGYIGMVAGLAACEVLDRTVGQSQVQLFGDSITMLKDPTVGLGVALGATAVLIVAGTIAGMAPARKASKIRPIEALRAD